MMITTIVGWQQLFSLPATEVGVAFRYVGWLYGVSTLADHAGCLYHLSRYAGILSAVGIHLADIVQEAQEPAAEELTAKAVPGLRARLDVLAATASDQLKEQGFPPGTITVEKFLNLR
jgi:N-methylhydantoinase A/oxoprolinase/acetone carboxylase beta subunit